MKLVTRLSHHTQRGMTLVEILAVSLLLVVVVVGFLGLLLVNFALNEHSRNAVIALNDAASVLERMRNITWISPSAILSAFPDGTAVAGYDNLTDQTVVVEYSQIGQRHVIVTVIVRWTSRGRNHEESLTTLLARR